MRDIDAKFRFRNYWFSPASGTCIPDFLGLKNFNFFVEKATVPEK